MAKPAWKGDRPSICRIKHLEKINKKPRPKKTSQRIYPRRPKLGIRAKLPNQLWHMDISIIRIPDNSRVFFQLIIDNYSRYVLAWKVSTS